MLAAFPPISPEVKERLHKEGFEPFVHGRVPDWANPRSSTYWTTNGVIFLVGLLGRKWAAKTQGPRIFWSSLIVSIPLLSALAQRRVDQQDDYIGHRKTLDERLDYHPITRRAWEKAVGINREYQAELRNEISELEQRIARRSE